MDVYKQIFISGRVQGVFFRESTRQFAKELKLTGFVRNLSDGRVEVQVTGSEDNVMALIKWLKIGPKLAKVSNIEVLKPEVSGQADEMLPIAQSREHAAVEHGLPSTGFEIWPSH